MSEKVLDEQAAGEVTRDVLGTLSHLGLYDTLVCEGPLSRTVQNPERVVRFGAQRITAYLERSQPCCPESRAGRHNHQDRGRSQLANKEDWDDDSRFALDRILSIDLD